VNQDMTDRPIHIGSDGFVYVRGVKVAKYLPDSNSLQFVDKDMRRSAQRGTRFVEVSVGEIAKLAER
jgi:hypothetical protein